MRLFFAIPTVLCLAACVTEDGPPTQAELESASQACTAYGFKPGTDAMASCVASHVQAARKKSQEDMAAFGQALQNMGNSMQQSAPVRTTCNRIGNQVHCTTY